MQRETNLRSILKTISWRAMATFITALLVFLFTGALTLAITVGLLELFVKMGAYFVHERLWDRIKFGKEEIPSFVVWFTGLPASRKRTVADIVFQRLRASGHRLERIDSHEVRPLFPETDFSPEEVHKHIRRSGHLAAMLEKNGVSVVASFVSPYRESRRFVRALSRNFVEVYMKSTPEACADRDPDGKYEKARRGELQNFPGVDLAYEAPHSPEITIDVDALGDDEAARLVVDYLERHVLSKRADVATIPDRAIGKAA